MNSKESVEMLKKYRKELCQKFNDMTPEQWKEYASKEFKKLDEENHSSSIEKVVMSTIKIGLLLSFISKSENKN